MDGTSSSVDISTKLRRIAQLAKEDPKRVLTTLAHHIDVAFLREAYRLTRKDGASGVDGQTAEDYAKNLDANLEDLLARFKSRTYRAPAVRRVYIPKGDGKKRPLGIPTFEDKILQRAVTMVLTAVYEQDFLSCSYGFRPGRSPHQALRELREGAMSMQGGWVLDVDIQAYFDNLDHGKLREILDQRVRDGVLRRTIDAWLAAGVMEEGRVTHPESGTPQGGVISPLLANVYLHEVLDTWFHREVQPRLRDRAFLVRFADDFVIASSDESDARRVLKVLPKRFGRYGLTLHPEKTRLVPFRRPARSERGKGQGPDGQQVGTFDFLGFTHLWTRSRRGYWVIRRQTSAKRLNRGLKAVAQWCRRNRHLAVALQREILSDKLRGHYAYYGITGNSPRIAEFHAGVLQLWKRWLGQRSQRGYLSWARYKQLLRHHPLPLPRLRPDRIT